MNAIAEPTINRATVLRREELVAALQGLIDAERVIHDADGRRVYGADASRAYAGLPLAIVMPVSVREVSQILRFCYEAGLKVFARGAGTSLSGGAVGAEDGILLCMSRMRRVIDFDPDNQFMRVEAGVTNGHVAKLAASKGLQYPPDPAARSVSTIGGNIATNAGGARGLCYGATAQHVLGVKIVLIDGEIVELGGCELEASGFDLVGLIVGCEGMIGVVVEATLALMPRPEASSMVLLGFQNLTGAVSCAGAVLSAGATPVAIQLYDRQTIAVCEDFGNANLPRDVEVLLVLEIEGHESDIAEQVADIVAISRPHGPATTVEVFRPEQVETIRQATDAAFTALGRLGPIRCIDIAVPPSRLGDAIARIGDIAARHNLRGANLGRAGSGILQSVFFEESDHPPEAGGIAVAMAEVAHMAVELGGLISAEHGVGLSKRDVVGYQLSENDMSLQARLKSTFDTEWLLNNGKVLLPESSVELSDTG